jgi:hypothetical protein
VGILLKGRTRRDDEGSMISTPLSELDLTDIRSAMAELRVQRVRMQVRAGTYRAPVDRVAEAIIASSLIGLPPDPRVLAWAC